jgi:hypothetical protein
MVASLDHRQAAGKSFVLRCRELRGEFSEVTASYAGKGVIRYAR